MEIITVIKIGQNGELCTYAYSTLEKAIEVFPVIQAYHEIHKEFYHYYRIPFLFIQYHKN